MMNGIDADENEVSLLNGNTIVRKGLVTNTEETTERNQENHQFSFEFQRNHAYVIEKEIKPSMTMYKGGIGYRLGSSENIPVVSGGIFHNA